MPISEAGIAVTDRREIHNPLQGEDHLNPVGDNRQEKILGEKQGIGTFSSTFIIRSD